MAVPILASVSPATGPASGGDLVRLRGSNFAARVAVRFGDVAASVVAVREDSAGSLVDVRTPLLEPGVVDVALQNLDAAGVPVAGEFAILPSAYRSLRPTVARESDLTRAVRQLLRELKRQVLANVSATVSVDYDDNEVDGQSLIAMARVPSLVLSGPVMRPNRFYSQNVPHVDVMQGADGPELVRRKPPQTMDLVFTITAASERTAELFNLMAAVSTFLNRNRWLELLRDPIDAERGAVRWELDAEGDFRTQLGSRDDVRAFSCGFVVRGFDVDEGLPLDVGALVLDPELQLQSYQGGVS